MFSDHSTMAAVQKDKYLEQNDITDGQHYITISIRWTKSTPVMKKKSVDKKIHEQEKCT